MSTSRTQITDSAYSREVCSKNKPLSKSKSDIKLKVVSMEERKELRIPSYHYLLP